MPHQLKLSALVVASQLDIKSIKNFLEIKPLADTSSELFYGFGPEKFQYYFNYGVVVFVGHTEEEIKYAIKLIYAFLKNPRTHWLRDDHDIRVEPGTEPAFQFNEVVVGRLSDKILRIAMFNLAQSVALDYYHETSEHLLTEIKTFTRDLETTGKLSMGRKNMMKFMGKALNTQNEIAENIYIFDAPELVWEDEYLDKLHKGLIRHYDLRTRFSEIEYMLRIIEDNLSVFREISHQRESNLLEWIIIILILLEVFDLFISRLSG